MQSKKSPSVAPLVQNLTSLQPIDLRWFRGISLFETIPFNASKLRPRANGSVCAVPGCGRVHHLASVASFHRAAVPASLQCPVMRRYSGLQLRRSPIALPKAEWPDACYRRPEETPE